MRDKSIPEALNMKISPTPVHVPSRDGAAALALERPVLLVIDIQMFYFAGGRLELVHPVEAGVKARSVLDAFRAKGLPVVHVMHMPKGIEKFEPGKTDGQYAIHESVAPAAGETVIVKHYPNAFRETGLAEVLKKLDAKTLVITGMQTHMCVEAAVRAGADMDYDIVLAADACATRDLRFGGTLVPAAMVHAAVLAAMDRNYARVVGAADVAAAAALI